MPTRTLLRFIIASWFILALSLSPWGLANAVGQDTEQATDSTRDAASDPPQAGPQQPPAESQNSSGDTPATEAEDPIEAQITLTVSGIDPLSPAELEAAKEEFNEVADEWRAVFLRLNELRHGFVFAENRNQVLEIQSEWAQQKAAGEALVRKLEGLGMQILKTEPDPNSSYFRFVIDMFLEHAENEDWYSAYRIALLLRETGYYPSSLDQITSVCCFFNNHYEDFENYFENASDQDLLDRHQMIAQLLPEVEEKWQREKELRKKDVEKGDLPRVLLETTAGDVVIELFEDEAPNTVANFISLVEAGFYDGLVFHRVIQGFMAQGGCPEGTGGGDAGYTIPCEVTRPNHREHFLGSVSMAHRGQDTGSSQFFICFTPQSQLDGKHTVFGRVVEGMQNVEQFEIVNPEELKGDEVPTTITRATVIRKRDHEYQPERIPLGSAR